MKYISLLFFFISLFSFFNSRANSNSRLEQNDVAHSDKLEQQFMMDPTTPGLSGVLKNQTFHLKEKSVPILIKVMKSDSYPVQNRWHATMLLARIMGKKASPFIAKFTDHPHWMMRVASLKALLGLKQADYIGVYSKVLKDPSLIVRTQALDNISQLKITKLGDNVWNMMYDQSNYSGEKGARKRTAIVKTIIRTLGDIKYERAKKPLARLIQKSKYTDLALDLDYSLAKITGKASPESLDKKRVFWAGLNLY